MVSRVLVPLNWAKLVATRHIASVQHSIAHTTRSTLHWKPDATIRPAHADTRHPIPHRTQLLTPWPEKEGGAEAAERAGGGVVDALSILKSGEFSDTGSAGTWTDADTEELHHNGWRGFDHLSGYG